ncbi:hypothetical protein [Streptomyces eurythermus]
MSGCGCGQGPVIVSGTQAPARVDVETVLLCDVLADGTVAATVLVEPVYDTNTGARIATRLVDPATGATYTPIGTLGLCSPPADECARQITEVTLCDDTNGDGVGDTEYVQVWALDPCDGGAPQLIGTYVAGDYSTPYTPTALVECTTRQQDTPVVLGTVCYDDGVGGAGTAAVLKCQACNDPAVTFLDIATGTVLAAPVIVPCPAAAERSTQLLCDVQADGTSLPFLRMYTTSDTGTTTADTLLDGTTPYAPTGTVGVCQPVSDCSSPTTPTATIGLCLPDGTPIAVTVVRDCDGVVTSEGWINLQTGAYSAGAPPTGTVACGSSQSVQVSGTFCDVDAAGDVVGLVLIEYSYAADGTIASVRLVDATTGATYTPTGTVTTCPAGVEQPEQDALQLCDIAADGTATPFIRDFRRDELGTITGHSDYTLDGTAYAPTGTVGVCPSLCLNCETVELCDSAANCAPTSTADTDWSPRYLAAGDYATPAVIAIRKDVPGGGTAFWGGGSTVFPNNPADADGGNDGLHYGIAGTVTAADFCPDCLGPDDQVTITASGQATNDGPGGGQLTNGRWRILRDGGEADGAVPQLAQVTDANRPAGTTWSFTATATVPWADVLAGRIVLTLDLETRSNGAYKQWTASGFDLCITPATPRPGCGTSFLRVICRDCTGAIASTTDYEADGVTPYTPVGEVGQCITCTPAGAEACQSCETVQLCDVGATGATITGTASSGTLTNGVAWTATNPSGLAQPPNRTNTDGAWWGLHTFPNAVTAPTKWTFSRPSIVEFSVYLPYNGSPAIDQAQLPAGLEIVHLPDGYAYDQATGVLTRTVGGDPCDYVTTPQVETSARFRTPAPVTSYTTAPAPNSRVARCGIFITYYSGAVTVIPGGPFLRTLCRSCDGSTVSVTDTRLDGTTPYVVAGTAGVCQPPAEPAPEPCCQPVQVCIEQDTTQQVEFISNEQHRNDDWVDPVWKWTTDLNAANPTWYHMYQRQYSAAWSVVDSDTARPAWWVSPHPGGASAQSSPALPGEGPSLLNTHWYPRAYFDLPDNADPATIKVQATVFNADQIGRAFRLNSGAWQTLPATATHNGTTYQFGPATIPGAQAGRNTLDLDVEETVGGGSGLMVHLKVFYEVIPEVRSWTRMVCCDDTVYYLDEEGQRQDTVPDGWHLAPCGGGSAGTTDCTKQVVERCGCDDTTGDGAGDVTYTELWAVDLCNGGAPELLGTYLDGDLTQPYTPTAPVECTAADQPPGPLSTGVRNVTGTTAQNIAGSYPGVQSVSLTVLAGTVNVTMSDGAGVAIPAGVTMTWSVAKDEDAALAAASFAGATAASNYLLNWTYR